MFTRVPKQIRYLGMLFLAIAGSLFLYHSQTNQVVTSTSSTAQIVYDYSIKTEVGKPIKVVRAIDGDTIEFVNGDRLRYIGIDTPEEVDPRKPVQCYALEAARADSALVEGKMITFTQDVTQQDKYGRWLGFVYLEDGTFVNKQLVEQGFAFAYPYRPDISKSDVFKNAEATARGNNVGLWAHCKPYKLSSGREQTNTLN